MNRPLVLIGLYSPTPHCGKSTIAAQLWFRQCKTVSFAEPIRKMLLCFLEDLGIPFSTAYHCLTVDKEAVIPEIGVTARHLMRTLGTEWGRTHVDDKVWTAAGLIALQKHEKACVDDVRFPNEASMIRSLGGEIWLVTSNRDGFSPPDATHQSDHALRDWEFDRHIRNDGTKSDLYKQVDKAWSEIIGKCAVC